MDEIEILDNSRFSTLDYVLLVSILSISFIIGLITSLKGNKSPEEFLLGNRNFSPISVSMSLLTTIISAVNIVGITTEVYVYGTQLSPMSFGCMAGIAFSIVVIIPVIYPLKLISIHEYIDLRFHAPRLQIFMTIIAGFNAHVWIGLALYATSLALSAVSPISFTVFILVIGSVCTIYSTVGGIRAVVYTDVFQFVVMSIGLFILIIVGFTEVGGVEKLFEIAEQGKRLEFFNTFSSALNALVALIWRDLFCKYPIFANAKPKISTIINKILTLIVGSGFIAMAFATSKASSIIQLALSVGGILFGSALGIFVLGMCFPLSNWKGAWCGFTGSVAFCSWICVGHLLYGTKPQELPFSTAGCDNMTVSNMHGLHFPLINVTEKMLFLNNGSADVNEGLPTENSFWLYFFDISYTLYSVMAPLLAIIIGLIVSRITRDKDEHEVPAKLLSPVIYRFYGKKYLGEK